MHREGSQCWPDSSIANAGHTVYAGQQSRRIRFDLNRSAAEARVQMGKQTCRICSSSSNSTEISSSMLNNIEVPCTVVQSKQCKWGPSGLQILYLCSPNSISMFTKFYIYVHQGIFSVSPPYNNYMFTKEGVTYIAVQRPQCKWGPSGLQTLHLCLCSSW